MKTKQIIPLLLALSAALWACSKEAKEPLEAESPDVVVTEGNFSLKASTDAVTKTELGSDFFIYWKSGDALSVWEEGSSTNNNVRFDLSSSSVGERIGTFTGTLTAGNDPFKLYAVYPYKDSYASNPSALTLSLPTQVSQVSDVNGVVGISDFMLGSATFSSSDENYTMRFRYPLTLLDIVVDGSGSCLSGAIAQSVTITANKVFVGEATVDLTSGSITPADVDAGKSLVIDFPATANMSTAQHAWVAIYPVDLSDADCCFDLKMTNGQEIKFNVNPKKAFQEQKIYTINLTNIDKHVDDGKAQPIFFDLVGANGGQRANCYIVPEGGYYKFAAQHIDKENVFSGTAPYTDGYTADWLWAEGSESPISFVGVGNSGAINFRVGANPSGNAVIAFFNPSSDIIWSWHIWMVNPAILEPEHWSRNNSWSLANCNLGATSAEEGNVDSYGLYYQWGRKDPFPASRTLGQNSASKETTSFNTSTKPYVVNPAHAVAFSSVRNTVAGATDEIAYTIAHPTTFVHYYANNSTTGLTNTWFYKTPVTDAQKLWNNTTTKSAKTNYDPCPPGWCVPTNNGYAWNSNTSQNYVFTDHISAESNTSLSGFVYNPSSENTTYYPASGYRAAGQLINVGYVGYYWSASTNTDTMFTAYGLQYEARGTKKSPGQKFQTAYALPVRCMKI